MTRSNDSKPAAREAPAPAPAAAPQPKSAVPQNSGGAAFSPGAFAVVARSPRTRLALRVLGALLLLFVGLDHYHEYSVDDYSVLPTIGTLFLLNFISATVVGLILLAPLDRILHRFSRITLQLARLIGFGIATTSLIALLVSEQTKLFGFMESNYRPAIIVAILSEASAAVVLLLVFVAQWGAQRSLQRANAPFRDPAHPLGA